MLLLFHVIHSGYLYPTLLLTFHCCLMFSIVVGQGSQVPLLHDHDGGTNQSKLRNECFHSYISTVFESVCCFFF